MKQTLILLFVASIINIECFSQTTSNNDSSKTKLGIIAYYTPTSLMNIDPLGICLNISKKRHVFYFGLRYSQKGELPNHLYYNTNDTSTYRVLYNSNLLQHVGFLGGYQYYPFNPIGRFNVFLEYSLSFFTIREANAESKYLYTEYLWQNTLGYGLQIRLCKQLYLYQTIGAGAMLFLNHSNADFLYSAKFGLGYNF